MIIMIRGVYQHHFIKNIILYMLLFIVVFLQIFAIHSNPFLRFSFLNTDVNIIKILIFIFLLLSIPVLLRCLIYKVLKKADWIMWILPIICLILFLLNLIFIFNWENTSFHFMSRIIPDIILTSVNSSDWVIALPVYYLLLLVSCSASFIFAPSYTGKRIFIIAIGSLITTETLAMILNNGNILNIFILVLLTVLALFIFLWPTNKNNIVNNKKPIMLTSIVLILGFVIFMALHIWFNTAKLYYDEKLCLSWKGITYVQYYGDGSPTTRGKQLAVIPDSYCNVYAVKEDPSHKFVVVSQRKMGGGEQEGLYIRKDLGE